MKQQFLCIGSIYFYDYANIISKCISTAYKLREKSDYQDFYVVSKEEAAVQIEKAKQVVTAAEKYLMKGAL